MYDQFRGPDTVVLVGISFDEQTDHVLETAAGFSKHTGVSLRLVHVLDPQISYAGGDLWQSYGYSDKLLESHRKNLTLRLTKLAEELTGTTGQPVTWKIIHDSKVHAMVEEVEASGAEMIIVGARHTNWKMLPRGMSLTLGMAAHAPVPLMVVPDTCKVDFSGEHRRVLVADDLQEKSRGAIGFGCGLAVGSSKFDFYHLHVHPLDRKAITDMAQNFMESMATSQLPYDKDFSEEKLFENIEAKINEKMDARLGMVKNILERSDGHYSRKIGWGDARQVLREQVEEIKPDFIVLGRHRMVHLKPPGLGKLPFYALLSLEVPIVIAP